MRQLDFPKFVPELYVPDNVFWDREDLTDCGPNLMAEKSYKNDDR
jgi:hypothetical protein